MAFACGVLDHHGGAYPLRTVAAAVRRWGIDVRRPHVTRSHRTTFPETHGAVRLGLGRVRGLSAVTIRRIVSAREEGGAFASLDDFLDRARPSSAEAASLLLLGACDGLEPVDADLYPFLHEGLAEAVRSRRPALAPLGAELAAHVSRRLEEHEPERIARYRSLVRVRNELQLLEMHLSFHPMSILRPDAQAQGCRTVARAATAVGERVRVAALLGAGRRVPTRAARRLRFLTLEDESGLLEAVLRPSIETSQGYRVTTPGPYLVEGLVRDDRGHRYLEVDEIRPFHWRQGAADGRPTWSRQVGQPR